MDVEKDWLLLSNQTKNEIVNIIKNLNTMACPNPEMWLMYNLKLNIMNLILARFKYIVKATTIFTQ
jgi:hypothetical protein